MRVGNLLANVPPALAAELSERLVETAGVRLERIVSRGHTTPPGEWYDQDRDEWAVLLKGAATLRFESPATTIHLHPGDYVLIPAHRRHRVERTDPEHETIWLALHFENGAPRGGAYSRESAS